MWTRTLATCTARESCFCCATHLPTRQMRHLEEIEEKEKARERRKRKKKKNRLYALTCCERAVAWRRVAWRAMRCAEPARLLRTSPSASRSRALHGPRGALVARRCLCLLISGFSSRLAGPPLGPLICDFFSSLFFYSALVPSFSFSYSFSYSRFHSLIILLVLVSSRSRALSPTISDDSIRASRSAWAADAAAAESSGVRSRASERNTLELEACAPAFAFFSIAFDLSDMRSPRSTPAQRKRGRGRAFDSRQSTLDSSSSSNSAALCR